MLILSRREGETIVIDGKIRITVMEVRGDHVRIGIDAPRSVSVHREEVFEQISRANEQASTVSADDVRRLPRAVRPSDSQGSRNTLQ
jgi:carbon storage regulator